MYYGTQAFTTANQKSIQKHRIRGTVDSTAWTGGNVLSGSLTITNQCSDNTDSKIGAVYVGKLVMTFLKNFSYAPTTWKGKKITVAFGLCIDDEHDTFEYFPLGQYYVSEANITADGVTVTAYDVMTRFDKKLPSSFLASGKPYDIASAICNTCDVEFGMTVSQVEALPNGEETLGSYTPNDCVTYRDVLYWLSQAVGSFATINSAGKLVFRTYSADTQPATSIGPGKRVQGAVFSDFATDFGSCIFENEDGTENRVGSQDVGATYYAGFNPFLQFGTLMTRNRIRHAVFDAIQALSYTPFKIDLMSAPVFELGDVVEFTGGIIEGTDKIGVVQSVTYSPGKGVTIQGFGKDPALQDVKNANESANAAARRAQENSEVVYKSFENITPISVANDPVKVVEITFTTNKETDVEVWHEIQLQTARTSGQDDMTVQAVYYLDENEISRKPIETFGDDAFHILDLHYMMNIEETGSHKWEVFLEASGGTAAIRANDAMAVLKGQGISKADGWTGVIILDDELPRIPFIMDARGFVDDADLKTHNNELCQIAQEIGRVTYEINGRTLSEVINITLYQPEFAIITEDGDYNITDETGVYNIETE